MVVYNDGIAQTTTGQPPPVTSQNTANTSFSGFTGMDFTYTPTQTGNIIIAGICIASTANTGASDIELSLYTGTGTPPAANAGATGTLLETLINPPVVGGGNPVGIPFYYILKGLTIGVTSWIDIFPTAGGPYNLNWYLSIQEIGVT
jgi:hypothetical protein